ncbi:MAG: hypothetical protein PHF42_12170, partial [Pseudomonas sp.]|nr:hypothetical protein [Pseudomonas sp.]
WQFLKKRKLPVIRRGHACCRHGKLSDGNVIHFTVLPLSRQPLKGRGIAFGDSCSQSLTAHGFKSMARLDWKAADLR